MDFVLSKNKIHQFKPIIVSVLLVLVVCIFLVSLSLISMNSKVLGTDLIYQINSATANPFIGLFIGLLATAILQSSSTTTSITVALVASGTISLNNAIPIVLGANVGTTITSFVASLSHITKKSEFRKATSTAAIHSLFNIFTVLLIFPIQYYTNFLGIVSSKISGFILEEGPLSIFHFSLIKNSISSISNTVDSLMPLSGIPALVLSFVFLYLSIICITFLIKSVWIEGTKKKLEKLIFSSSLKSLGWGALLTAIMQSSSLICSLIVPIVATGKTTIKKALPLILGANIGTTVTALIAAFSASEAALSIAIVHLLFNLIGVLAVFVFPKVNDMILYLSRKLGQATVKNRLIGLAYMILVFFMIPFFLILFNKNNNSITKYSNPTVNEVKLEK